MHLRVFQFWQNLANLAEKLGKLGKFVSSAWVSKKLKYEAPGNKHDLLFDMFYEIILDISSKMNLTLSFKGKISLFLGEQEIYTANFCMKKAWGAIAGPVNTCSKFSYESASC